MIYAIAAYSITLSVLALYGVTLQHRERVFASEAAVERAAVSPPPPAGFNVGAALLSPFWMWQHGMRLPGVVLLALFVAMVPLYRAGMWIPLLAVGLVPLAAGAALGLVGNRIAAGHRGEESVARFSASQLPWALAGIALYTVVLPWAWFLVQTPS